MNNFDKQTMRQWLWDMDRVKAEDKRFEKLLTKSWDKRIEVLIKENRELRKENKELKEEVKKRKMVADENWTGYDMMKDDYDELEKENKELKEKFRYYKTKSEFLNKVIVKYQEENKELKNKLEEADKYVVLQKIKNWEF